MIIPPITIQDINTNFKRNIPIFGRNFTTKTIKIKNSKISNIFKMDPNLGAPLLQTFFWI